MVYPVNVHHQSKSEKITIDIFGLKRYYVFFIIELKSRKIVHYNVTQNLNIRFLRSQLSHFEELYPDSYLIHDNSGIRIVPQELVSRNESDRVEILPVHRI